MRVHFAFWGGVFLLKIKTLVPLTMRELTALPYFESDLVEAVNDGVVFGSIQAGLQVGLGRPKWCVSFGSDSEIMVGRNQGKRAPSHLLPLIISKLRWGSKYCSSLRSI